MSNTILSILQFILLYQMEADFKERIVKLKLTSEEGEAILVRPAQRAKHWKSIQIVPSGSSSHLDR